MKNTQHWKTLLGAGGWKPMEFDYGPAYERAGGEQIQWNWQAATWDYSKPGEQGFAYRRLATALRNAGLPLEDSA